MKRLRLLIVLLLMPVLLFGDTFGNTNNHSNLAATGTGSAQCARVTSPSGSGTITAITGYFGATAGIEIRAAIYSDGAGPNPINKLAESSGATTTDSNLGQETVAINYAFAASTVYWLCTMTNGTINQYYDSVGDNQTDVEGMTYPTWNDPYGTPDFNLNRQTEIFATYTPDAVDGGPGVVGGGVLR